MKILFLDIDGVLNGHNQDVLSECCTIKDNCMQHLNSIILATGCKIVISSAWRYMMLMEECTLVGFEIWLRTHGLLYDKELTPILYGHTKSDEEIPDRADQIRAYVAEHPEIMKWAVVDDLPNLHIENLVRTDGSVGLTCRDAASIIKLLCC